MWKEAVVAVLEVLSRPITTGNEKNHAREIEIISSKTAMRPQASTKQLHNNTKILCHTVTDLENIPYKI
jgi:hypothetical protein